MAQKLQRAQRTLADGLTVVGEHQTAGAFLEGWLLNSAAPRVLPQTLRRYQEVVRLHITRKLAILLWPTCHRKP